MCTYAYKGEKCHFADGVNIDLYRRGVEELLCMHVPLYTTRGIVSINCRSTQVKVEKGKLLQRMHKVAARFRKVLFRIQMNGGYITNAVAWMANRDSHL